ncbi:hypothetical protein C8R43DRAFT_1034024 [Mycena crocata]|nr:hypothetical protein C8R43DRAFT_1034024 [Mycena crocata]
MAPLDFSLVYPSMSSAAYHSVPNDAPEDGPEEKYLPPHTSRFPHLVPTLVAVICLQTVALVLAFSRKSPSHATRLYSPAQDLIEETITVYPLGFGSDLSPFQVSSSPELDKAWDDLYNFGISRIPKQQAALLPNKTSPIPGDPGYYIAELDVFHELHCLNMIRKALDPDYYPDWNIKNVQHSREHVSHCVDWIRQSIMCHADTSVIVWQWSPRYNQTTPRARIPHTCRKFEPILEWGRQNALLGDFDDSVYLEDELPVPPVIY